MGRFDGKTAIVTGGSSGIGAATARRFARDGANVVITYHSHEQWANEVVADCIASGAKAIAVYTDMREPEAIKALVEKTAAEFGGVDILCNIAGRPCHHPIMQTTVEEWDDTMALNLRAYFLACKYAIPYMLERGGGAIVNTASTSGWFGGQGSGPAYVASKHAIHGLTKQVVCEYGPQGIRCNTVCPGLTRTPMVAEDLKYPPILEGMKKIPGRRVGEPEDLANIITFLCSDEADYIHGDNILCDGGLFEARTSIV